MSTSNRFGCGWVQKPRIAWQNHDEPWTLEALWRSSWPFNCHSFPFFCAQKKFFLERIEQTYSDVTMRSCVAEATTWSKLGMETVISSDGNSSHWAWELGNFGAEQSTPALQAGGGYQWGRVMYRNMLLNRKWRDDFGLGQAFLVLVLLAEAVRTDEVAGLPCKDACIR